MQIKSKISGDSWVHTTITAIRILIDPKIAFILGLFIGTFVIKSGVSQEALNIWRGKLFHFFQILYNHMYPKVIVISIVDLQKTNNFGKFGGCCPKNAPATPLRSLKW